MPLKSSSCIGSSRSKALCRCSGVSARIISWTMGTRLASMNMNSVRHNPIPSAPKRRAWAASCGLSALARTLRERTSSAQERSSWNSPESSGSIRGTSPCITCPVPPSIDRRSPSRITVSPTRNSFLRRSMRRSSHPQIHGFPMPRATTAAWLVMPPRLVRIPWAARMPWISSGVVSGRTRITFSPSWASRSAVSASKTTFPDAAPGEAGKPLASTFRDASGSMRRWRI